MINFEVIAISVVMFTVFKHDSVKAEYHTNCDCPGKWMPPFRASKLLYSEFPEHQKRSLDTLFSAINHYPRKSVLHPLHIKHQNHLLQQQPLMQQQPLLQHQYHFLKKQHNTVPRSSANSETNFGHKTIQENYSGFPSNSGEVSDNSEENYSNSATISSEETESFVPVDFNKYNGYTDYTVEVDNNIEADSYAFNELNNVSPYKVHESNTEDNESDEKNSSIVIPTVLRQISQPQIFRLPIKSVRYYPNSVIHSNRPRQNIFYRMPIKTPGIHAISNWKTVLARREMDDMRFMKPPPLGQPQTWLQNLNKYPFQNTLSYIGKDSNQFYHSY